MTSEELDSCTYTLRELFALGLKSGDWLIPGWKHCTAFQVRAVRERCEHLGPPHIELLDDWAKSAIEYTLEEDGDLEFRWVRVVPVTREAAG